MNINIEINLECEDWNVVLPQAREILESACEKVCYAVGLNDYAEGVELSVLLTDNDSIQQINNDHRGKDKPTNVLSFPSEEFAPGEYEDVSGSFFMGDLAFGLQIIREEAKEQEKSLSDHFTHLSVHGILHLLGFDHIEDSEAEEMEALEVEILEEMGVANPY